MCVRRGTCGGSRALLIVGLALSMVLGLGVATPAAFAAGTGTLVDAGFENGVDGGALATPPWGVNGTPQHGEYDSIRAKTGSQSAWIQGPTTASNAGVYETATGGMTANGSEMRFWLYLDSTTQSRLLDEYAPGVAAADRAASVQFGTSGTINVLTDRVGNPNGYTTAAYTPVGTYTAGWTQYRIVYDFASQTYTLSKRSSEGDAWTQLKASGATGYAIPFKGANTISATHGTLWRGLGSAQMWVDDIVFADGGIVPPDTTAPSVPGSLLAVDHPADAGGAIDLGWTVSIDNVGVTGYRVYRGTAPGVYGTPTSLGNVTAYTDATVVAGTKYYYAVSAVDAAGNESAKSSEFWAVAVDNTTPPPADGTLVDAGFENGVDGGALATPPWGVNGTPQHGEYDSIRAKTGSQSAWIQGPTTASNAGVYETATGGMTANGSEMRFWLYLDSATQSRVVDEYAPGVLAADRAFSLQFAANGLINVLTDRSANGYAPASYTPVGTYTAGWTQYRIVYNFASQTYTLSKRAAATDPWTQLKAAAATGFDIPFRGTNTISATHGTLWRGLGSAQMWVDDIAYADGGILEPVPVTHTITASAGANGAVSPAGARTVADGGSASFTITADAGYAVSAVLVDGVSVGTEGTYTFANVTADHTISATFAAVGPSADMPISYVNCDSCHALGSARDNHDHPCANCHEISWGHADNGSLIHTPAVVTACTPCHNASLTVEHYGRKTDAGADIVCNTCHGSADAAVQNAISAGNSACVACHAGVDHQSQHSSPVADCAGTGCHNGSSLIDVHTAIGCEGCHASTKSAVTSAIASHDKSCTACHGSADPHGDLLAAHASTVTTGAIPALWSHDALWSWPVGAPIAQDPSQFSYKSQSCTNCHTTTNLLRVHGPAWSCSKCHAPDGPRSSFAEWDGSCQQGACHPSEPHSIVRAQSAHLTKRMELGCGGSCHTGSDWGTRCDTTCHTVGGPAVGEAIDIAPPVTRATQVGTAPLSWKLFAHDFQTGVSATYFSLDGADFKEYGPAEAQAGVAADGRVGTHVLRYYSQDASGNIEAVQSVTGVVDGPDTAQPSVTVRGIRGSGGSVITTSAVVVVTDGGTLKSGASRLNVSFKAYKMGWGWTLGYYWKPVTYSVPLSEWDKESPVARLEDAARAVNGSDWVTVSSDGNRFIVKYSAVDRAGNVSPEVTDLVVIDNAAPVTTVATVTVGEFRWKLNVSDSAPLGTYYSFDGAPFSAYTAADATAGVVNTRPGASNLGAHTLSYYSEDALGHVETVKTHTYSVIETTPPMASLSATMTANSVVVSAWDPEGPVQRSGVKSIVGTVYQGATRKSISTTFAAGDPSAVRSVEVTVPADGFWTLDYYVYDWDGNSHWYNQGFYRDTTPPSSSLGGGWNTTWQLSAGDGFGSGLAGSFYSFDGAPYTQAVYGSWCATFTTPAPQMTRYGTHTLSYYSVDKYGFAETPRSTSWFINDTTKPTVTLATSGGTWSKSAYLTAQDAVPVASGVKEIRYRFNDGPWVTTSFDTSGDPTATVRADLVELPNGIVKVDYDVVDVAGNASTTATSYIQIDNAAPVVSVTHESTNPDGSIVVRVAATEIGAGSGVDRCWYEYIDGTGALGSGVITGAASRLITLPPPASGAADATVSAYARDWNGNECAPVVLVVPVAAPPQ